MAMKMCKNEGLIGAKTDLICKELILTKTAENKAKYRPKNLFKIKYKIKIELKFNKKLKINTAS